MNRKYIDELSKSRAAFSILLFLNENGETKLTGIIGKVSGQRGTYTAIRKLLKLGLIKERKGEAFPYPRLFSLTETGKRVAENLTLIEAAVDLSASFEVGKKRMLT